MSRRERRSATQPPEKVLGSTATEFYESGLRHMIADQHVEAQRHCLRALAADPDHADALHMMGVLALQANQNDEAVEWLSRAIRQQPKPAFLSSLGAALLRQGRREEAVGVFDKAVQLKPDDAALWMNLGNALIEVERPADGILCLQHALRLDPRNWSEAETCGILLHRQGRVEEALHCFDLCDELRPGSGSTMYMRGRCLIDLKRIDEGLPLCHSAHALDPANADITNCIGLALQVLGQHKRAVEFFDKTIELRKDFVEALNNKAISLNYFRRWEEALQLLDRTLEISPSHVPALINKALSLSALHRFGEAFKVYDRVKIIDPNNADAGWNLAVLYLLTGNFKAGWPAAEARWNSQSRSRSYPKFSEPRWLGEQSVEGKTVLIYGDEGLGDTIQFARYVPMVVALGARVILVVGSAICPLLASIPGVHECISKPVAQPVQFDFHSPISSLPLIFRTEPDTIPFGLSYLPPLPHSRVKAWQDRLGPHSKMRVGVVWSGNPAHSNDHNRSIPLREFLCLLETHASFVSLQKDPRPADKAVLLERNDMLDVTNDLTDFVETGALILCLDLVITVDTSVAHLAGALGKPTWILLPYTPDHRWLLERDDSPWYPTVRLFRQDQGCDYAGVLDRVRTELNVLIAERTLLESPHG